MTSNSVTSALERWSASDPDVSWRTEKTLAEPEIRDIHCAWSRTGTTLLIVDAVQQPTLGLFLDDYELDRIPREDLFDLLSTISEGRLHEDRGILRRRIELVSPTTGRRWRGVASAF